MTEPRGTHVEIDPDAIDRLVAARGPSAAERAWTRIPWRYDVAAALDSARTLGRRVLLVVVEGALGEEGIGLGARGAWSASFVGSGMPELLSKGWTSIVVHRTRCRDRLPPDSPVLRYIEGLPATGSPCALACVVGTDPSGRIAFAVPAAHVDRARLATQIARLPVVGSRAEPATPRAAFPEHGTGFRLEASVRRTRDVRASEPIAGFPVEPRTIALEDEIALALGPPTAHGVEGQSWRLPSAATDRIWRCVSPFAAEEHGFIERVRGSIEAEVVSSGRGCRVRYRARWENDGAAIGRAGALRVRAEGYGVFGADRMPRAIRFATMEAWHGARSVVIGVREA